ncbi:MAG: Hpt domain-containing protein, partial [Candidatus Accumulibacter sp.]|nr:Hpt domain-containing protein [Accumulibacter sp.]
MSDFGGMEDLLQDFLQEAGDLLSDVDNKLVDLERSPDDGRLLNDIFRGFHTIKGGAGFLNAGELVKLCHLTENLFDKLRNGEKTLSPELMDTIMAATQGVREMFGEIAQGRQPVPASPAVADALRAALEDRVEENIGVGTAAASPAATPASPPDAPAAQGS